ncbi:MAG: hypothetical protein WAK55_25125, partial [Xanthobacteraceae bacterium]
MLYHADFQIEYPASMSQKDFLSIWAKEAEAALSKPSVSGLLVYFGMIINRDCIAPLRTIWLPLEGRVIDGSWAVEKGIVRVRTALGEKIAPLEGRQHRDLDSVATIARDGGRRKG